MQARDHVDADGTHIVELSGEVDLHRSVELRARLDRHVQAKRAVLLVDLTGVTYIDSAGLATLIEYVQKSYAFGGRLVLGGIGERLRTIFDIARLDQVFALHPTLAEAKAAVQA